MTRTSADYYSTEAARTPDGFRIVRLMPGFAIYKGRQHIGDAPYWTHAVAMVKVEREARRAIRKS